MPQMHANETICLHVWGGGQGLNDFSHGNLRGMEHSNRDRERPIHALRGRVCTSFW